MKASFHHRQLWCWARRHTRFRRCVPPESVGVAFGEGKLPPPSVVGAGLDGILGSDGVFPPESVGLAFGEGKLPPPSVVGLDGILGSEGVFHPNLWELHLEKASFHHRQLSG